MERRLKPAGCTLGAECWTAGSPRGGLGSVVAMATFLSFRPPWKGDRKGTKMTENPLLQKPALMVAFPVWGHLVVRSGSFRSLSGFSLDCSEELYWTSQTQNKHTKHERLVPAVCSGPGRLCGARVPVGSHSPAVNSPGWPGSTPERRFTGHDGGPSPGQGVG